MKKVSITVRAEGIPSHPLWIGEGVWEELPSLLPGGAANVALMSDRNVDTLYGDRVEEILKGDHRFLRLPFPPGEESKCRTQKEALEEALFSKGLGRDTVIVALGGGVTTDLAGFTAATYMRGVPLILLPTSYLAMVDAAIGGKTGINVPHGKNLLGAFHHPIAVAADLCTLQTLPEEEKLNGAAETAKAAVISDEGFFESLTRESLFSPSCDLVARAAEVKVKIVEKDPREKGLRQVLNFGHTLGHALERISGYTLSHGRGVALGMHLESRIAEEAGILPPREGRKLREGLTTMGLPPDGLDPFHADPILHAMKWDKKNRAGTIRFALPRAVGAMAPGPDRTWSLPVDRGVVEKVLKGILS
jgi:3-dehydroquinate synthase